jgi:hypothetical protein
MRILPLDRYLLGRPSLRTQGGDFSAQASRVSWHRAPPAASHQLVKQPNYTPDLTASGNRVALPVERGVAAVFPTHRGPALHADAGRPPSWGTARSILVALALPDAEASLTTGPAVPQRHVTSSRLRGAARALLRRRSRHPLLGRQRAHGEQRRRHGALKSLLVNPSPARDAPHPRWRRCRRSTHKNQCDSLLRLMGVAGGVRGQRELADSAPGSGYRVSTSSAGQQVMPMARPCPRWSRGGKTADGVECPTVRGVSTVSIRPLASSSTLLDGSSEKTGSGGACGAVRGG